MHEKQKKLLYLLTSNPEARKHSLRKLAELLGEDGKPQLVKHHLSKLEEKGWVHIDKFKNFIEVIKQGELKASATPMYSIPVVGSANCGPALLFAEENIQQYLKVSSSMLPHKKSELYALIADGDSMNTANINGKTIESGDFVLVDSTNKSYKNNDIVVAVIDGMATIKKFREDKQNQRIVLEPQSTGKYMPIYIHENDDFVLSGKVVDVIKR